MTMTCRQTTSHTDGPPSAVRSSAVLSPVSLRCLAPVVALAAAMSTACAPQAADRAGTSHRVAVQPRLVMDGLVDLERGDAGRIVLQDVMFHAPTVTDGERDILATDAANPRALIFRYLLGANDGFGDALGGVRSWVVTDGAQLSVGFSALAQSDVAPLSQQTGLDLAPLANYTAVIRGSLTVKASTTVRYAHNAPDAATGDTDMQQGETDPDTSPAHGASAPQDDADGDDCGDSDPDTSPADQGGDADTPDADAKESDPDTSPAHSGGDVKESDPDTSPADAAGRDDDPNSANTPSAARHSSARKQLAVQSETVVPFTLVVTTPFAVEHAIDDVDLSAVDLSDAVVPLELHVAMDELFTAEQVALIARAAHPVVDVSGGLRLHIKLNTNAAARALRDSARERVSTYRR